MDGLESENQICSYFFVQFHCNQSVGNFDFNGKVPGPLLVRLKRPNIPYAIELSQKNPDQKLMSVKRESN